MTDMTDQQGFFKSFDLILCNNKMNKCTVEERLTIPNQMRIGSRLMFTVNVTWPIPHPGEFIGASHCVTLPGSHY